MIEVQKLAKNYGLTRALKGVSFTVERGDVLGFLGPNGAGKSTTMKILTGYLLPTGGGATVGGKDVIRDSLVSTPVQWPTSTTSRTWPCPCYVTG